ncbi:cation:proton antiporter [Flavihumibacter sp. UBA7668]|uniref:cation:proton antiporter domain-containing protein n=1 Tax=Flavihumibacter sp. UBA7668 TaxID=1946542 RepID=UPI0025BA90F0|nr:cation:proton antiporter [Flavihumibacter sp. UBA7668]
MAKNWKNLLFYVLTIGGFCGLMYYVITIGLDLQINKGIAFNQSARLSLWDQIKETYSHNFTHPLAILLLQIITIILTARFFGYLFKLIGQPTVIGEIVAGIFLGPSFIGMYFPEFSAFLFPAQSLGNLQFLSQIGLILFMFIIGMELDLTMLKNKAHEAVVVSHASIVFPFALGVTSAYFLYDEFAPAGINFASFALFIGISLSITAFPVLARIVQERNLTKTKIGTLVITCAAADDITAWCLLAAVIAIVKAGSFTSSLATIAMAVAYVFLMLKLIQPFLQRMGEIYSSRESLSKPVVAVFFITLLFSAYATEVIGIHALFGAFMAGVIMPPNMHFRSIFIEKVEDVALVLLLPLFFVFTGLRTQIGLLNEPYLWKICAVIILIAITGKFFGSAMAAKFVGQNWRNSLMIGALMNTRGLVELVVLNIGFDLGVLSPQIFTMLVLMALVTTVMTGPALDLINKFLPDKKIRPLLPESIEAGKYRILVSFGTPEKGRSLLKLANSLVKKATVSAEVVAMHLSQSNELNQFNRQEYEAENFIPIQTEAEKMNLPVISMFKATTDIDREISETANAGNFDLLLIGMGRSVFEGTLLGKVLGFTTKIINPERLYDTIIGKEKLFDTAANDQRTFQIVKSVKVPVGILIEKDLDTMEHIYIPIFTVSDAFLILYAQKLIHHNQATVTILDVAGVIKRHPEIKENIRMIEQIAPRHISLITDNKIEKDLLEKQDLLLISIESWKKAVETHSIWLSYTPSVLILKQ